MFIKEKLTDFEKLLFAEAYIKELRVEIGKLKSEVDEYKAKYGNNLLESIRKLRSDNKKLRTQNVLLIREKQLQ